MHSAIEKSIAMFRGSSLFASRHSAIMMSEGDGIVFLFGPLTGLHTPTPSCQIHVSRNSEIRSDHCDAHFVSSIQISDPHFPI
jgi:hypothetical protein